MKNTKRILAFILVMIMAVLCLVACGGDNGDDVIDNGGKENSGDKEPGFNVPAGIAEGKLLYFYIGMPSYFESYIAEDLNGEDVNDLIYERNSLTEQHTGADIEFVGTTNGNSGLDQMNEAAVIRTLIQANDDTYSAFINAGNGHMLTMIAEGMYVDWNTVPHINLDNPWWCANVKRDVLYGNKVYYMTGDSDLTSLSRCECLIFNKNLCRELNLEYPYEMVFDGTWTHDKFVEYIKTATKDLNGDGAMDLDNDRYGFGGWAWESVGATFIAYGGQEITKDEDNLPVLNIDNEHTYNVIDAMLEVFGLEGSFDEYDIYGEDTRLLKDGRLLFKDGTLATVVALRGVENLDVGFVPYPKLDENQESFYSRQGGSNFTFIPITNTDLDATGAVLETLAYYSNKNVIPRYFDIILTVKSTRDVESEDMIPIIRNATRFVQSHINAGYGTIIREGDTNTLSSQIAANKDIWEAKIEEIIATYE